MQLNLFCECDMHVACLMSRLLLNTNGCFQTIYCCRKCLYTFFQSTIPQNQGRIQPVSLGGAISAIFGSQVSFRVHYCKRDEVYFTTLLWQSNGRQNGLISRMLFSKLYKIMVTTVSFVGFRGGDRPNRPHWIRPCAKLTNYNMLTDEGLALSIHSFKFIALFFNTSVPFFTTNGIVRNS